MLGVTHRFECYTLLYAEACEQGYTIEVEIHDGPYNVIPNWDYVKFVEALDNGIGASWATRVRNQLGHQLHSRHRSLHV